MTEVKLNEHFDELKNLYVEQCKTFYEKQLELFEIDNKRDNTLKEIRKIQDSLEKLKVDTNIKSTKPIKLEVKKVLVDKTEKKVKKVEEKPEKKKRGRKPKVVKKIEESKEESKEDKKIKTNKIQIKKSVKKSPIKNLIKKPKKTVQNNQDDIISSSDSDSE